MATKWNELGMEPLRTLLRHIKSGDDAAIEREFPGIERPTREQIYAELTRRDSEIRARRAKQGGRDWHTAPDGSPCCCTAEDDRYGCGCGHHSR